MKHATISPNEEYRRFHTHKRKYIDAMHRDADPEELHSYLRELLREAIKMDVTLVDLLKILSDSSIEESDTEKFIENVSRHYAYGVTAAKMKHDKDEAREIGEKTNKRLPY